jgi:hypothetical protein
MNERLGCMRLETPFRASATGLSTAVEVTMWNRFISSPGAHLITAVGVTLGLVAVLLTANPKKTGFAEADASARNAPAARVSENHLRTDAAAETSSIRLMQDDRIADR